MVLVVMLKERWSGSGIQSFPLCMLGVQLRLSFCLMPTAHDDSSETLHGDGVAYGAAAHGAAHGAAAHGAAHGDVVAAHGVTVTVTVQRTVIVTAQRTVQRRCALRMARCSLRFCCPSPAASDPRP